MAAAEQGKSAVDYGECVRIIENIDMKEDNKDKIKLTIISVTGFALRH